MQTFKGCVCLDNRCIAVYPCVYQLASRAGRSRYCNAVRNASTWRCWLQRRVWTGDILFGELYFPIAANGFWWSSAELQHEISRETWLKEFLHLGNPPVHVLTCAAHPRARPSAGKHTHRISPPQNVFLYLGKRSRGQACAMLRQKPHGIGRHLGLRRDAAQINSERFAAGVRGGLFDSPRRGVISDSRNRIVNASDQCVLPISRVLYHERFVGQ